MSPETKSKQHPLIRVINMDRPGEYRLVALPAQEAVMYCAASDLGAPGDVDQVRSFTAYYAGWWTCGPYKAKDV